MKFTLEIELGNEAMDSPYDVAWALERVCMTLKRDGFTGVGEWAIVPDVNGNTVGKWAGERMTTTVNSDLVKHLAAAIRRIKELEGAILDLQELGAPITVFIHQSDYDQDEAIKTIKQAGENFPWL